MGHPIHERKNTAELPLERANRAINYVMQGKNVSIVSSGDSGIYGMAGIVFDDSYRCTFISIFQHDFPGLFYKFGSP